MPATYRAAIIGHTGAGDYGHGLDTCFQGLENVKVVAVADPDPGGREAAARRTGAEHRFADYRLMLSHVRPDLVSVAPRWIDRHHEMILACCDAGVKGIYCEKPFARTLREADEMLAACRRSGTVLAIAHQNRALPYLARARQLIQEGAIGTPLTLRGRGKDDRRGGALDLIVLGTHTLDQMRALAGDPRWAWGHLSQDGRDVTRADVVEGAEGVGPLAGNRLVGCYQFAGNLIGTFESVATTTSRGQLFGIVIEGTEGMLALHGGFSKQMWLRRGHYGWLPEEGMAGWERIRIPEWELRPDGTPWSDRELLQRANQRMVAGLIEAIERGTPHFSSGEDARWALEMIFAIPESYRLGRRVTFPLANRDNPYSMLAAALPT